MTDKQKAAAYATYTRQRVENVRAIISEHKARRNMTNAGIAKAIHMPLRTFEKRKMDPGLFKLEDLWLLCEALGVPEEQRKTIM
ncbi:hypothetical protein [[Clostridium] symbiosum]|uniref:hypothetical protein n=1 Tax=Clostridium symbiosum TaxID=1512 RepID=UPI0022E3AC27|nr:hypothetical protein [[Clostridium] symbiosum]